MKPRNIIELCVAVIIVFVICYFVGNFVVDHIKGVWE